MEEFLTKQLASAGLGIGGVLVIAYLIHELSGLQKVVASLLKKINRIDKRVAVISALQGIKDDHDDESDDD